MVMVGVMELEWVARLAFIGAVLMLLTAMTLYAIYIHLKEKRKRKKKKARSKDENRHIRDP